MGDSTILPYDEWISGKSQTDSPSDIQPLHQWLGQPDPNDKQAAVQAQVVSNRNDQAQLAQRGNELIAAGQHPVWNAANEAARAVYNAGDYVTNKLAGPVSVISPEAGRRLSTPIVPAHDPGDPTIASGRVGAGIGQLATQVPQMMVAGPNRFAQGAYQAAQSGIAAYESGAKTPQVVAQTIIGGLTGWALAKGLTGEYANKIAQEFMPHVPALLAKAGIRGTLDAAINYAGNSAQNIPAGRPLTEGSREAAAVGGAFGVLAGGHGETPEEKPFAPPAEDRHVLPQENMTAQGGSERPPMPIAETPKETAPSAPQEQVKPPVSTPVETGWASEKPTLPDNAASMDAGQLRKFANDNGVPIDRTIIANKMEKQQMTPRQAMLQYLQERVNPGKTAGLPKMPPLAPENEPGYVEGGLGSGKGHIDESTPAPAEREPILAKKPLTPIPKDFDSWSNRQARQWLQDNGYQPKAGVGKLPLLADAQRQYEATGARAEFPPAASDEIPKPAEQATTGGQPVVAPASNAAPIEKTAQEFDPENPQHWVDRFQQERAAGTSLRPDIGPEHDQEIADRFAQNAKGLREAGLTDRRGRSTAHQESATPEQQRRFEDTFKSATFEDVPKTDDTGSNPNEQTPQHAEPFEKGTRIISGGSDAVESSIKAVKEKAPSHAIEPDTFSDKTVGLMKKFLADESGSFDVNKFRHLILNGGHKLKDLVGGIADRAGTAMANFVGGDFGRSFQEKRVINAFRGVTSKTNRGALVRDALYRPYFDKLENLPVEQQDRLIDELEAGQKPSDPFFANFAKMWALDGKSLKEAAIEAKIPGAEYWNETQVGRQAAPLDEKGRAPWQEGYNPPKRGTGGIAPLNLMSRRLTGGRAEFRQAIESQGMAENNKNPFITAMQKRMQAWNYINHTKIAREQLAEGNIRKLKFGEKPAPNEVQLTDKFFNPFPPKMTAEAKGGLLDDLNDHTIPLTKRLSLLKDGIADGRIQDLKPSSPDAFEHYSSGIHEAPEHTMPGDVYEKYNAQGGTGEYGQTQARKMGGPQAEDHATGEYSPARKGNLPDGHGIVDDALLQAHKPRYVANRDIADLLNSAMEPSPVDPQNPFYRGWTGLNNAILATKFGLSGFHYVNLAMGAAGNRAGAAVNSLFHGRLTEAVRNARQAIPGFGTAELVQKGRAFRETLESPRGSPLVRLAEKAGGIIEQPESYEKEPGGNKLTPPSLVRGANKLLFEKYGDNLRRGVMSSALQDIVDQARKQGKGLDHPDVVEKARKAVQATFDTFDTLRKDKNYQSNAVRIAMKAAFSYPQWQLSKIRQTAQAVRDIPGLLRSGDLSSAQQAVVGNVLITSLAGGAMTWASTGEPPKDVDDFLHPWLFGRRVVLPGPYEGLISLAYSHGDIGRYLENRLSPGLSLARQYAQGRDYQGQKTKGSVTDVVRTAAKEAAPDIIAKPTGLDQPNPAETPKQQLGDLAGLHRAPKPPKGKT